jgi:hypothetical protein
MGKEIKKKKNEKEEKDGEVFYKAHPIAHPLGRVEQREVIAISYTAERMLWSVLAIVEIILLFRIVFAAFGATGGNIITSFFYTVSYPFVWFFFYLFNSLDSIYVTSSRFELETLAAMAFYCIVVYIIVQLIVGFRSTE